MTNETAILLDKLKQFKTAYSELTEAWKNASFQNDVTESSIVDEAMTKEYPFKESFDEIEIPAWVKQAERMIREYLK